jgi:hypothetical protein
LCKFATDRSTPEDQHARGPVIEFVEDRFIREKRYVLYAVDLRHGGPRPGGDDEIARVQPVNADGDFMRRSE